MKKIIALFVLCCMLLAACGNSSTVEKTKGLNIVTTVFPAYDFARTVAGEENTVSLLLPPGTEVHSFEPTPKDIIRIENSDLLICNGGESEAWLEEIIEGLGKEIKVIRMMDCVETLREEIVEGMQDVPHAHDAHDEHDEEHEHEHEHEHENEEFDEHVWTSPINAILITQAICDALTEIDADNADSYQLRTASYCEKLKTLDAEIRAVVNAASEKTLIFADRFPVRYFVEEYGLKYYAAFSGCADDAEPSAKTVAFLIDRVREYKTPAVLYIEFSDEKMADQICEDTGCKKLRFHSCHNVSAAELREGVSYYGLMMQNLETLKEALG